MIDTYVRKLAPKKIHFPAVILLVIGIVLLWTGIGRAGRVRGRLDPQGQIFDSYDGVKENASTLSSFYPLSGALKGGANEFPIVYKTEVKFLQDINCYIVYSFGAYRPLAVVKDSEEEKKMLAGEEVTGYFTYEYSEGFGEFMDSAADRFDFSYSLGDPTRAYAPEEALSHRNDLGIRVVDREWELRSWLWSLPFLIAGAVLFKIAGSPFIYVKKENPED